MSRTRYVWHDGRWVDVTGYRPPPPVFPAIHRDTMDPLMHHATGEFFDSKSRFREVTKAHGLIELGNDTQITQKVPVDDPAQRKQDIADAITALEQGYTPPPADTITDWGETRVYEAT